MTAHCNNSDQSKRWLKIRREVWNYSAGTELFSETWMLLGKRRQPTDGRENTPISIFHLLLEKLHHCKIK